MKEEKKAYTGLNRLFQSPLLQVVFNKIDDGTFREFFSDWRWIFTYSKKYKEIVIFYTFLGILSSSMSLASAYVSKNLINIIVDRQKEHLWILLTTMILFTLLALVFNCITSRIGTRIAVYVNNDIQAEIFGKIVNAEWTELNRYQNGDLLNRFSNDVGTISQNAINWIPNLIINLYTFIATFIVLFRMDPIMAYIALISAPVLFFLSRFIMKKMRAYKRRILEMNSGMMSFEVETFYNMDTIKSFGIIGHYFSRLKTWQKRYKEYHLDYNKFEIKANVMMTLISMTVSMTAFCYCLYRLWTGQILYGDMTFFLTQRTALTNRFDALVHTVPGMISSAISAHRIRELTDLPKEEHDEESYRKMCAVAGDGITVEMNGVTFSYKDGINVYQNCSFTARPNEIVAVLGSSGEGKTTLLRMILGLIHPETGTVTMTGSDGQAVPVNADLRLLFSYVPQGNTLMAGSIAENMKMVKEDATEEEMIQALKMACAWDFIRDLPDGLNTPVGEKGRGFSEGQAQRIAIARAILRDSPILLLDEATSALDTDTEEQVLQNIIRQRPNKTCIVSTHRPSVLKLCQRIYRIENKEIKEETAATIA